MSDTGRVPLKLGGIVIGSAVVKEDDTIELLMDGPNGLIALLLDQIKSGTIGYLSIRPMTNDRPPRSYYGEERQD